MALERAAFLMTKCNQEVFTFASHFSRRVEAGFTAGQVSSDGGALLLREADRKIGLLKRVASCFSDGRSPLLVQHQLVEMLSQRIYGLALGYEDLNDHEQLRHDPLMAVLSGRRKLEEPLAGKSTLNRLELPGGSKRYHKIDYMPEKIDVLLCDLFIESHAEAPEQIVLTWMQPTSRSTAISRSGSFMVTTTATATCRSISSPAINCYALGSGRPTSTERPARWTRSSASWPGYGRSGPRCRSCCAATLASVARS
jgi:hypothetical protein